MPLASLIEQYLIWCAYAEKPTNCAQRDAGRLSMRPIAGYTPLKISSDVLRAIYLYIYCRCEKISYTEGPRKMCSMPFKHRCKFAEAVGRCTAKFAAAIYSISDWQIWEAFCNTLKHDFCRFFGAHASKIVVKFSFSKYIYWFSPSKSHDKVHLRGNPSSKPYYTQPSSFVQR